MDLGNLFNNIPDASIEEKVEQLMCNEAVRIERIVSKGQISPEGFWYDQEEEEFVLLLKGGAKLQFEGEEQERLLSEGDCLVIPAHCRHRVSWTSSETEAIWLAIFVRS
ncbi:MAG: phosphoribosylaminoimidazole carboxylase [Gammaproteobacteria bacterium]|nr:MAG: phosphoribosylaminoimidazole carboxylase [Gammaproteobacteria bacterium]RLA22093.1 MAG: phosphoribosylaminoimidazole carboxylase [Gammaproteobacteria bacterium]